jgi:hypothetical protein
MYTGFIFHNATFSMFHLSCCLHKHRNFQGNLLPANSTANWTWVDTPHRQSFPQAFVGNMVATAFISFGVLLHPNMHLPETATIFILWSNIYTCRLYAIFYIILKQSISKGETGNIGIYFLLGVAIKLRIGNLYSDLRCKKHNSAAQFKR